MAGRRVDIAGRAKSGDGVFPGLPGVPTPTQERSLPASGDAKRERAEEGVRLACDRLTSLLEPWSLH